MFGRSGPGMCISKACHKGMVDLHPSAQPLRGRDPKLYNGIENERKG